MSHQERAEKLMIERGGQLPRIAVLVSGRGSNSQALLDAIAEGRIRAEIALVLSNRPTAFALTRARAAGIPTQVFARQDYADRHSQQRAMLEALLGVQPALIVLAGFDQILIPEVIETFPNQIINVHPSLLPSFGGPGMKSPAPQQAALDYGVKLAGCTVHFVTNQLDAGPVIAQSAIPVLDEDTVETLSARILVEEHKLLPAVVALLLTHEVGLEGRRVKIHR